jgi:flavin reductase (DIM6/NTAB) family NADH-FMN oxidoreductase RutF
MFERKSEMTTMTLIAERPSLLPIMAPPSVAGDAFRQALGRLAAGVSIVTTIDEDGHNLGLTATAVTSVSLDPPLVLVCIDNRSRTIDPLETGAPFVVHFLAADQEELARRFASRIPDKFAGVDFETTAYGCPRLTGVLASVECLPHAIYPGGDHTIFVGRVVDVQIDETESSPLTYFRGQFMS